MTSDRHTSANSDLQPFRSAAQTKQCGVEARRSAWNTARHYCRPNTNRTPLLVAPVNDWRGRAYTAYLIPGDHGYEACCAAIIYRV